MKREDVNGPVQENACHLQPRSVALFQETFVTTVIKAGKILWFSPTRKVFSNEQIDTNKNRLTLSLVELNNPFHLLLVHQDYI